jgi:hypothetical protein
MLHIRRDQLQRIFDGGGRDKGVPEFEAVGHRILFNIGGRADANGLCDRQNMEVEVFYEGLEYPVLALVLCALEQLDIGDRRYVALVLCMDYELACFDIPALAENDDVGIKDHDSDACAGVLRAHRPSAGRRLRSQRRRGS